MVEKSLLVSLCNIASGASYVINCPNKEGLKKNITFVAGTIERYIFGDFQTLYKCLLGHDIFFLMFTCCRILIIWNCSFISTANLNLSISISIAFTTCKVTQSFSRSIRKLVCRPDKKMSASLLGSVGV